MLTDNAEYQQQTDQEGMQHSFKQGVNNSRLLNYKALTVIISAVLVCIILTAFGFILTQKIVHIENQLIDYNRKVYLSAHSLGLIEDHFGYGGFIHNFKNYVLRQDPELIKTIETDLAATYQALDNFPLDKQHQEAVQAIADIRAVVDRYAENFLLAQKLSKDGLESRLIDQRVKVDDRPATEALEFLNKHSLEHSRDQIRKTKVSFDNTIGLMKWGFLLLPAILLVAGVIVIFIRHNLKIHQELVNTGQYLNDLFEAAPEAMLIVNNNGNIVDVNEKAIAMFGYSKEQFLQKRVEDLMPKRYQQQHIQLRDEAFKTPTHRSFTDQKNLYAITSDNKELPVEISLDYTRGEEILAITTLRDVSEQRNIESRLRRNENMFNKAQQIAHIGSWEWDIKTNKLVWSEEIFRIFGLNEDKFGASYDSFVEQLHPDDREAVVNAVNEAVVYDKPYSLDHRIIRPDGSERYVQERGDVFRDESGEAQYMVGTMLDITERKHAEIELRLADNVFNQTTEAIIVTDADARILRVNHAFNSITGYKAEEVIGKHPREVLQSGKHDKAFYEQMWSNINTHGFWEGEIWDRRKDASIFPSWHTISAIKDSDDRVIQYTSLFSDITEKKIAEEHIQHLAQYDQLTKLPNRTLFADRLKHAISLAKRSKNIIALMFIDLDRFKSVNDSLGHQAGDELLQEVAQRLTACVREQDTVARLGGDEFTIILEGLNHAENAAIVANNVLEALAHKVQLGSHEVIVGGSIGISIFPDDGEDTESIIKNADLAMYQAKHQGKNQYQFYTTELTNQADSRFRTENRLRQAIIKNEFELYYQPQFNWLEGRIIGAEALIRWNDPDKGLILPTDFISMAEEMRLIDPIGEWVLETACMQAKFWQDDGYLPIRVSVNVSGSQIMNGSIVDSVNETLAKTHLDPRYLELEITESFVMENPSQGAEKLAELRKSGITIAVDDFGTGYSSLSYLKQLPINRLKIDRSFVMDIPHDKDDEAIVSTIIAMAKSLDLSVIAEGVENQEQIQFLSEHGCVDMQGYYFAKPLPRDEFVKLLQQPTMEI